MEQIPRDFKGIWIPKEIWLDQSLTYFEKCLLAEIHSLNGTDGCFASNEYLANFFNERERKIQEGLSKLKSKGYIYQENFDGRKRVLRTNLNPESVNTKFNTSDMSNSAPLPCGIPHPSLYIENKENNIVCADTPLVAASPLKKIKKKSFDNTDIEISKDDLFTLCIQKRKDWTEQEIDEAWNILAEYPNPLRNWFSFCEGTIQNNRKMKKIKQFNNEEVWEKNKKKEMKPDLKKQLENSNPKTLETGMLGHLWESYKQQKRSPKQ